MPKKRPSERKNAWIRKDLYEAIEKNKPHPKTPIQAIIDDILESGCRQRHWIGSDEQRSVVAPAS